MDIDLPNQEDYQGLYEGSSMVVDFNFENGKFVTTIYNDIAEKGGSELNVISESGIST